MLLILQAIVLIYLLSLHSLFLVMCAQPANIPYSCKDENNTSKEWKTPSGGKEKGLIRVAIRSNSEVQIVIIVRCKYSDSEV